MPDGVTIHSPVVGAAVVGPELAGGAAVPPVALVSAVWVRLSAVQAAKTIVASVNG